jgi:hypothetical protein
MSKGDLFRTAPGLGGVVEEAATAASSTDRAPAPEGTD